MVSNNEEKVNEEWLSAEEITIREFNALRGKLFSAIESVGLPFKQERALITLIRHLSFQQQRLITDIVNTLDERGALFRYKEGKLVKQ